MTLPVAAVTSTCALGSAWRRASIAQEMVSELRSFCAFEPAIHRFCCTKV
jgi:hypothetical protein